MTHKPVFGRLGVGDASERAKNMTKKNFRPWRCFLIPWSFHDDKNSSIYRNFKRGGFFCPATRFATKSSKSDFGGRFGLSLPEHSLSSFNQSEFIMV